MNKVCIENNKRISVCVDDKPGIDLTDNYGQVCLNNIKAFLDLNLNSNDINYEEIEQIYKEGVEFFINSLLEINKKEEEFINLDLDCNAEEDMLPF